MKVLDLVKEWEGYSPASTRGRRTAQYMESLAAFTALAKNTRGFSQRQWAARMEEAISTDDFPTLFGDVIDREMLAAYRALPPVMRQIGRVKGLTNFKTVRRSHSEGVVQRLTEVSPQGEYQGRKMSDEHYTYAPKKYGARVDLDWEGWLNDDMGLFDNIPQELADSARNTEDYLLTSLFMDASGPLDSYFAASTGQGAVSSNALTIDNLATAVEEMTGALAGFRADNDEPILNTPKYLMVGPALELTAKAILRSVTVLNNGGSNNLPSVNPLVNGPTLTLIVNPWIPVIDTTKGATAWYLFSGTIKPFEMGQLRGHEGPELFMKSPNAVRVGGGAIGPMEGDFDRDTMAYKVRYVQGQVALDPRGGWASDGS